MNQTITDKVRDRLIFGRMHTAILETPLAVLGAAISIGTLWDYRILYWILFGIVYHYVGYGMNSYVDWKKGFDKVDPSKANHPLNKGTLNPKDAKWSVIISLIALIVIGEVASGFRVEAHISIAIMLISGVSYNYFGKYTRHKYIPIAIVHTMVFVLPYTVYSDGFSTPFILATAALFIHHVYQILISGDLKDIRQDESSLIQDMGTRVVPDTNGEPYLLISGNVKLIGTMLVFLEGLLALCIAMSYGLGEAALIPLAVMMGWTVLESDAMLTSGPYNRDEYLSRMSRKELTGYWMIIAAFIPVIGAGWLAIIAVSMLYFLPISKFMWGNWVKPEV